MTAQLPPTPQESLPSPESEQEHGATEKEYGAPRKNGQPARPKNAKGSGNGCGYDPKHPRFPEDLPEVTKAGKNRPKFLGELSKRINWLYNTERFPDLNKTNGSKKGRKIRGEGRESIVAYLKGGVAHFDILTGNVVRHAPKKNESGNYDFIGCTRKHLVGEIFAETRVSLSRLERGKAKLMTDTKEGMEKKKKKIPGCGYITSKPIAVRKPDGSYDGRACIVHYTKKLFGALGLTTQYRTAKAQAVKEQSIENFHETQAESKERREERRGEQAIKDAAELERREKLKAEGKNPDLQPGQPRPKPQAKPAEPKRTGELTLIGDLALKSMRTIVQGGYGETGPPEGATTPKPKSVI
jgi:hypothetical protein